MLFTGIQTHNTLEYIINESCRAKPSNKHFRQGWFKVESMVYSFINKFSGLDEDDICSIALEQLYKLFNDYDSSKGAKATTLYYSYLNRALIPLANKAYKNNKRSSYTQLDALDSEFLVCSKTRLYIDITEIEHYNDKWAIALELYIQGYKPKEIATKMSIAIDSVYYYFSCIRDRFDLSDIATQY